MGFFRFFYIYKKKDFTNEHISLFYLTIFPPQATTKICDFLYTDIVYTVNLDAILASCDIKYIKHIPKLDEQQQQFTKQG